MKNEQDSFPPFDLEDWIEEKYEEIAARYEKAGTRLKGGVPIAQALREAFALGQKNQDG